jgi:peptidoglycan/LPS O-acetylase OafA/YrhL
MSATPAEGIPRRHDLDALRAFAMLLGIGLHASLSFTGFPWIVQDIKSSMALMFGMLIIHGFRMQLFMVVSGYFTMMLWRKRGLRPLMKQRFQRVLIPCLLGLATIVPALEYASVLAARITKDQNAHGVGTAKTASELIEAIRSRDLAGTQRRLAEGDDPNAQDLPLRMAPLHWAAISGDAEICRILLEKGSDVDLAAHDGTTPLHLAVIWGNESVARELIEKGADPNRKNQKQRRPVDFGDLPAATTLRIFDFLNVPKREYAAIASGRAACLEMLLPLTTQGAYDPPATGGPLQWARTTYADFLDSDRFLTPWTRHGEPLHLFRTGLFHHLWFLWYLSWLIAGFAVFAVLTRYLPRLDPRQWNVGPRTLVVSAIALTALPQAFMGILTPTFGPDTSTGILPEPHVLAYYAVFFGFGAILFDKEACLAPWLDRWRGLFLVAFFLALPLALAAFERPGLTSVPQVVFSWAMVFGMMGLFRSKINGENRTIRYVSDSAYWIYLAHLPLVVLVQAYVRPWDVSVALKFCVVCSVVMAALLLSYRLFVRNSAIGRLLNGPRKVETRVAEPA